MATTTNYAWETPDDTDLVKDGASAIRTLGSSIDTTTKALNPSTTLGDIEYRSATANTNTRLGIGTNGQVLAVNGSGVPAWTTISSGGMTLLSTTSLSGTSTTVSGISGTYKDLKILVQGVTLSANAKLTIQANGSSSSSATAAWDIYSNTRYSSLDGQVMDASYTTPMVSLYLNNYANSSYSKIGYFSGVLATISESETIGTYCYDSNSAITSIRIGTKLGTATFNAGQVLIYGVS